MEDEGTPSPARTAEDEPGRASRPTHDTRAGGTDGGDARTDDGYVHQPRSSPPSRAPAGEGTFDWRSWVLVAVVVIAFLVVPVAILTLPRAQSFVGTLGLGMRDAYLVLPLVPAFLLGIVAVWAAVRSRAR